MKISQRYRPGLVWLIAGLSLLLISIIGLLGYEIPGIEEFISWVQMVSGYWILLAAFLAITIEGLYFVGSFFPGSTLIILLSVSAQLQSLTVFAFTILAIFAGWIFAGAINIFVSARYVATTAPDIGHSQLINNHLWLTWYPAFRANQEVAAVVAGQPAREVFLSSVLVKLWASLVAALLIVVLPHVYDVTTMKNDEGFLSILLIATVMVVVGLMQLGTTKAARNNERL